jgi:plastocyanin
LRIRLLFVPLLILVGALGALSIGGATTSSAANTLTLNVGGGGSGVAANDFFPDSITINAGTTMHFSNPYAEIHTVTFEPAGTASPAFIVPGPSGPPQFGVNLPVSTPSFSGSAAVSFDPTKNYNSGILQQGNSVDVVFPGTGTFTFICVVHGAIDAAGNATGMALTVKVISPSTGGADSQASLDTRGAAARDALISKGTQAATGAVAVETRNADGTSSWAAQIGTSIPDADVVQFLPADISVKTGDTINWTNGFAVPHTVTFTSGAADPALFSPAMQPAGPPFLAINPKVFLPSGGNAYDGTGYVNSGILQKGTPFTTFSLKFTAAGTYKYVCELHANQGMVGTITVTGAPVAAPAAPSPVATPRTGVTAPNTGTGHAAAGGVDGGWLSIALGLAAVGALVLAAGRMVVGRAEE